MTAQANAQCDQAWPRRHSPRRPSTSPRSTFSRTFIRSPIDGVAVSRNVDVGRAVAASLEAPVLFLIAQDLTKMQVLADIDKAGVGQLSPDSKVSLTVDAFPTETFKGTIDQIRRAARGVNGRIQIDAPLLLDAYTFWRKNHFRVRAAMPA